MTENTLPIDALPKRAGDDKALCALQQAARERLATLPFPGAVVEQWRHTKPQLFDFARVNGAARATVDVTSFRNGESIPASVEISTSVPESLWDEIAREKSENLQGDAIAAFQLAAVEHGLFIRIKKNAVVESPLLLRQAPVSGGVRCPARRYPA